MGLVGEKERAYLETTRTHNFLKEKFRDYYANATLKTPPRFTSREWGFLGWSGKLMNRHQSFSSKSDLQRFLSKNAPRHAYHSVAYYKDPGAKSGMKDKIWQGADLIFDLDADHIPNAKAMLKDPDGFQKLMGIIQMSENVKLRNFMILH